MSQVGSARLCVTYRKSRAGGEGEGGGGGGLSLTPASLIGRIFASFKNTPYKVSGLLALLYLAQ